MTTQPGHLYRLLAFLDPLLGRSRRRRRGNGELRMEPTGMMGLAGFDFLQGGRKWHSAEAKAAPAVKMQLAGSKVGAWYMLNFAENPKWKSQLRMIVRS